MKSRVSIVAKSQNYQPKHFYKSNISAWCPKRYWRSQRAESSILYLLPCIQLSELLNFQLSRQWMLSAWKRSDIKDSKSRKHLLSKERSLSVSARSDASWRYTDLHCVILRKVTLFPMVSNQKLLTVSVACHLRAKERRLLASQLGRDQQEPSRGSPPKPRNANTATLSLFLLWKPCEVFFIQFSTCGEELNPTYLTKPCVLIY